AFSLRLVILALRSPPSSLLLFLSLLPPPPRSTLFPYTTLFRSRSLENIVFSRLCGFLPDIFLTVVFPDFRRVLTPFRKGLCHRRSEEHTSELQSRFDLVCRLLLEKKKTNANSRPVNDRQEPIQS